MRSIFHSLPFVGIALVTTLVAMPSAKAQKLGVLTRQGALFSAAEQKQEVGGLSLSLQLPKLSYRQGERIRMVAKIENEGESDTFVSDVGQNEKIYRIDIRGQDGFVVPLTHQGAKMMESLLSAPNLRAIPVVLEPGGSQTYNLFPSDFYDMSQPGSYWLHVSRLMPSADRKRQVVLVSNTVKMTVLSSEQSEELAAQKSHASAQKLQQWSTASTQPDEDFALSLRAYPNRLINCALWKQIAVFKSF